MQNLTRVRSTKRAAGFASKRWTVILLLPDDMWENGPSDSTWTRFVKFGRPYGPGRAERAAKAAAATTFGVDPEMFATIGVFEGSVVNRRRSE